MRCRDDLCRGPSRLYRCPAQPYGLPLPPLPRARPQGSLERVVGLATPATANRSYRSTGVEDRRRALQRVILQLGRACWSLATPSSVAFDTRVSRFFTHRMTLATPSLLDSDSYAIKIR